MLDAKYRYRIYPLMGLQKRAEQNSAMNSRRSTAGSMTKQLGSLLVKVLGFVLAGKVLKLAQNSELVAVVENEIHRSTVLPIVLPLDGQSDR